MPNAGLIRHWSTRSVPPSMRFDYWMSVMRTALWPVSDFKVTSDDFIVDLEEAPLGCISSMIETNGPHEARRTQSDVKRTEEHCYHLFISLDASWGLAHHGHTTNLRHGDVVLVGEAEHQTVIPAGFHGIILKCPATWLCSWIPDPDLLAGRAIEWDSKWGRVLSPTISQLTPAFAAESPLPHSVVTDQLGTLLALAASENEPIIMADLLKKIANCIQERCTEPQLTADSVASTLDIPSRLLHRILSGNGRTFANLLLDARVAEALQMLTSRTAEQMTNVDIARRAGFLDLPHFSRVMKKRTGRTPSELRQTKN